MKNLEKGSEKVKKICDAIKLETIEPALEEARSIIISAREDAGRIIEEAQRKAEELLHKAKDQIAKEKHIFDASLNQASKQALESLRQELESKFFKPELTKIVTDAISEPKVIAKIIEAIVLGLKEKGTDTDFTVYIPKHVTSKELAVFVSSEIVKNFMKERLEQGLFEGGIKVKCLGENLTIDISEQTLGEFLAEYVRKDLRQIIFRTT